MLNEQDVIIVEIQLSEEEKKVREEQRQRAKEVSQIYSEAGLWDGYM